MGDKPNMKMIIEDLESLLSTNFGPSFNPPQAHHCLVNSIVNLRTFDTRKERFDGQKFYGIMNYF